MTPLKAVRHPRGTLINYIFTGSSSTGNPHYKWAESYNIHQSFAEGKYYRVLSLQTGSQNNSEKKKKFLTKFHTVDNNKLKIRTTSCPWHDSSESAHCGGEFGTKAQYPSPQTEPAARDKQQTLSIKNTQQDLTRWDCKISTSRVCKFSREVLQAHLSN